MPARGGELRELGAPARPVAGGRPAHAAAALGAAGTRSGREPGGPARARPRRWRHGRRRRRDRHLDGWRDAGDGARRRGGPHVLGGRSRSVRPGRRALGGSHHPRGAVPGTGPTGPPLSFCLSRVLVPVQGGVGQQSCRADHSALKDHASTSLLGPTDTKLSASSLD